MYLRAKYIQSNAKQGIFDGEIIIEITNKFRFE